MKVKTLPGIKVIEEPAAPECRWEHLKVCLDLHADLASYGEQGWELVSSFPIPHDPSRAMYIFKRRRT